MFQSLDLRPSSLGVGTETTEERFVRLKKEIHKQLVSSLHMPSVGTVDDYELRRELRRGIEQLCEDRTELLSQDERMRLVNEVVDETLGLGPLEPLLRDPTITDILINGPRTVYVERRGRLERTNVVFHDDQHLLEIVQRIASKVGRRLDESSPMVDARLADGSRVNAVLRPLALDGALVSIRRFSAKPLLAADLIARKSVTPEIIEFLSACVRARMNILISGGTGSGKTTFLNMLSGYIPDDERVATIEDAAELRLQQPHVARMETRPANLEGRGEITTRDLVRNALRMRPDRIVVGECRGAEAFDMLQAMMTGHEGGMTTIHSNDTREAISRLEMLIGMGGHELSMWFIRRQIASAIDIVVQCARLSGGIRRVMQVSEVTGTEGEVIAMQDLFVFEQTGVDENKVAQGHFRATGIRPSCLEKLAAHGNGLDSMLFERRTLETTRLASFTHASKR
ncbi:MAG TPA: CpaF family protein [Planctomycetaceae bacterium]|jgi:pilus assembly protein CpaF|nr:CpaF family protein [Planctomycetaceae bacterium]